MFFEACLVFSLASAAAAQPADTFSIDEECLNYTVYPVQYDLTIYPRIHDIRSSYYDCRMTILVFANAPGVTALELDAEDIDDIRDVRVEFEGADIADSFWYDAGAGKLRLRLRRPLRHGPARAQYAVHIAFRKALRAGGDGVVLVPYEDNGTKYALVTRLSPERARSMFPCFQQPRLESVFRLRLVLPPPPPPRANTTLSIAPEYSRREDKSGAAVVEFQPSPQVKLHQVALHYSPYPCACAPPAAGAGARACVCAPPRRLAAHAFALRVAEAVLGVIGRYAADARPLLQGPIHIVSVPRAWDGYEIDSWNLLTNSEVRLAHVPHLTSIEQQESMTFELARQLTRVWLGNPGEPRRTVWKEEWFKEGLATYLTYYFLTQYDHGKLTDQHRPLLGSYGLHRKWAAMAGDSAHGAPALSSFQRSLVIEHSRRNRLLIADKTAALLWMIENWLGADNFHKALVEYIKTRRGKQITLDDFLMSLEQATAQCEAQLLNGTTAASILRAWLRQPGFPVVHVAVLRDREPNVVQLKQQRFTFDNKHRVDSEYLIPISYAMANQRDCFNCLGMRFTIGQSYTFEEKLDGGWIILDRNASGYYRVNYDEFTWHQIANELKNNMYRIDELNRAQIVSDVFALYAAGDMSLFLAQTVLGYLHQESSAAVWAAAGAGVDGLAAAGAVDARLYRHWQEFMQEKISPLYERLVVDAARPQESAARQLYALVVSTACRAGLPRCRADMRAAYRQHLALQQRINPDIRETCYEVLYEEDENFDKYPFNLFEVDDKHVAETTMQRRRQRERRLPAGAPPAPLVRPPAPAAPPAPPTTASAHTPQPLAPTAATDGSLQINAPIILVALLCVAITVVR